MAVKYIVAFSPCVSFLLQTLAGGPEEDPLMEDEALMM